ncbi:sugar MFS transporter [Arthrobacter sp. B3I4]|uniref:MFS transporter n=1 Tax=Arthrobacter sp. B3I4 TaxID=3042267 RepID=UPI0027D818EF|nr:hypothetical protein [Arthrobacter sp. B3I4]
MATVLFHRLVPKAGKTEPENLAAETRTGSPAKSLLVLLAPVAAALFVYVGIETVFSGWSAVIATDVLALDPHTAAAGTSVFWVLMAAGRYAAWCILKSSVTPSALLTVACTLAVACFAAAGLVRQVNPGLAMVFSGVAILSLGPTYSLVLGIGLSRVKIYDAKKAVGLLVAIGAAGGAGIPAVLLSVTLRPGASRILVTAAFLTALIAPLTVHKKSPPEPSAEKNAD